MCWKACALTTWLNIEDFEKALSVARQRFPELPRKIMTPVPDGTALAFSDGNATASPSQVPDLKRYNPGRPRLSNRRGE